MSNVNELPPDEVTTMQLLMLVRDLRLQNDAMRRQLGDLATTVNELKTSFDTATTVVKLTKWLAAIGAAVGAALGGVEAIRRFF